MKRTVSGSRSYIKGAILSFFTIPMALFFTQLFAYADVQKGCDCTDISEPPFLSAGVDPNLVVIIDNSASMYDIAYTKEGAYCYDDTYDDSATYSGYFSRDIWYVYNSSSNRFEPASDNTCSTAAGVIGYYNDYLCINELAVVVDGVSVPELQTFKAKGNYLNWATASKFDIEKKILTGGKYSSGQLESEGRGCSGNNFIKQVTVRKSTDLSGTYHLVLGIRTDSDSTDGIDTTLIDILPVSAAGFDPDSCQEAVDLMTGDPAGFGQVKQAIIDCMGYTGDWVAGEHDKQALINSLHDCWYLDKQGSWPAGGAQGFNFEKWCEEVYSRDDPRELTPDDSAYVCYGNGTTAAVEGYIGECWNPADSTCHNVKCTERSAGYHERCNASTGFIEYCSDWHTSKNRCKNDGSWSTVVECTGSGSATAGWKNTAQLNAMGYADLDACITAARERFCNYMNIPESVDPSDLATSTGETWNLPAMLMEQGAYAQMGDPMVTEKAIVSVDETPEGLLQGYADDINIGVMAFNYDGAKSECSQPEPYVSYDCSNSDIKDGSHLVQAIGQGSEHTSSLVSNINAIKANSWTPLAEAMFNAIGYYTQREDLRINDTDFSIAASEDGWPVKHYCEKNNVLIITDGASTADLNPAMVALATDDAVKDDDTPDDPASGCGDLHGSTYLDDLTYYALHGDIFTKSPYPFPEKYQNIATFIVVAGTPDDSGAAECNPSTLLNRSALNGGTSEAMVAATIDELASKIDEALMSISRKTAAGSAASVIAATRSGEGAVYQAIFWPNMDDPTGDEPVSWLGEVHAVLVDQEGNLYEDTDGDDQLTYGADKSITDRKVVFYYDETAGETRGCYGDVSADNTCTGTSVSLHSVKYLWSAAEWLSSITDADITSNRSSADYISNVKKRYIFTWDDLDNDGAADNDEILPFTSSENWSSLTVASTRAPVVWDFDLDNAPSDYSPSTDAQIDRLIDWVRGKDTLTDATLRKRQVPRPENFNISDANITWRLGDIVHSTPTAVGKPVETFHMLYRDSSYGEFVSQYLNRRQVIYFGGNDGMLHAVNGGFFNENNLQFCRKLDGSGNCTSDTSTPELGAELWAYVPYNLLPHLHCLKEPGYAHKYYLDLKPRIFDVKIFNPDTDHPNGWGTILVAGMRLGGKTVESDYPDTPNSDDRKFVSGYIVMDITNPEKPPVLLGELTYSSSSDVFMGYTTGIPAVVPMKSGTSMKWYLVIGSGPTSLDTTSTQNAVISVFPLENLITGDKVFRIPDSEPTASTSAGRYVLTPSANGFVSDIITVDFDLVDDYRADALYFGTVEGGWGDWRGKMYRWATLADENITAPYEWSKPAVMFNPARPITAAASVGYDGENYWIYFGTGRFMHKDDKTDSSSNGQDYYFGLKEPMDCNGNFIWTNTDNDFLWDNMISNTSVTLEG